MLSDRDALFAAICANPEEDTPRLMFADWLEEQGDKASATRAEFIRLQCELAQLADDASDSQPVYEFLRDRDWVTRPSADWTKIDDGIHRRIALTMRAEDLLKRHGDAWLPKLPKKCKVQWVGFHRGFAQRARLGDVSKLKLFASQLRECTPAVTLEANEFTSEVVEQLGDAGLLGWIGGLDLSGECAPGLREFGHSPHAARVRELTIRGYSDSGDFASALAESPHWTGLRTLDLSESHVTAGQAETLFRAKNLRSLNRLHVRGFGDWNADTLRTFATGGFTELVSLRFGSCGLDDAAELLANCPAHSRLRMLDLPHNAVTGRGVTALLTSPHLANVSFLGLEGNPCTGVDAKKLAKAAPGGLRMLHAHGCRFNTKDVRALARCPRLRTLWYLDLDENNLGSAAVRELVRGFKDWCPPIVWLTFNRIDDRGAELLANWKAASALRVLHLKYNPAITDAGVRKLLDSPNLANLDGLGVSKASEQGSGANEETTARMKARFRHDIHY